MTNVCSTPARRARRVARRRKASAPRLGGQPEKHGPAGTDRTPVPHPGDPNAEGRARTWGASDLGTSDPRPRRTCTPSVPSGHRRRRGRPLRTRTVSLPLASGGHNLPAFLAVARPIQHSSTAGRGRGDPRHLDRRRGWRPACARTPLGWWAPATSPTAPRSALRPAARPTRRASRQRGPHCSCRRGRRRQPPCAFRREAASSWRPTTGRASTKRAARPRRGARATAATGYPYTHIHDMTNLGIDAVYALSVAVVLAPDVTTGTGTSPPPSPRRTPLPPA